MRGFQGVEVCAAYLVLGGALVASLAWLSAYVNFVWVQFQATSGSAAKLCCVTPGGIPCIITPRSKIDWVFNFKNMLVFFLFTVDAGSLFNDDAFFCATKIKLVSREGLLLSEGRWTWPCFTSWHQLHWLGSIAGLLEDIWKCFVCWWWIMSCLLLVNECKWSPQAFHMDRMVSDARAALAAHHKRADLNSTGATPSITSLALPAASSLASLPPNLVSALARVSHLPLLLIEVQGWIFHWSLWLNKPLPRASVCWMSPALQNSAISNSSWRFEWTSFERLTWLAVQIDEATCRARRQDRGEWGEVSLFRGKSSGRKYHERIPLCRTQTAGRRLLNTSARLPGLAMSQIGRGSGILLVIPKIKTKIVMRKSNHQTSEMCLVWFTWTQQQAQ